MMGLKNDPNEMAKLQLQLRMAQKKRLEAEAEIEKTGQMLASVARELGETCGAMAGWAVAVLLDGT